MKWLRRRPCLIGLPLFFLLIVSVLLGTAYLAPDKLRDITLKTVGELQFVAQVLPATLPEPSKVERAYWLPQNWSWQKRYWFHHTSQGTITIPVSYDWFLALERPELSIWSHRSLHDDDYLRRLGFIPSPSSKGFAGVSAQHGYNAQTETKADADDWVPGLPDNPDGLPVGFARLRGDAAAVTGPSLKSKNDFLGLTGAACHTGHIEYKNVSIRFDGGPAMVNLSEVERAVGLSIGYTLAIPFRFGRFARRLEEIKGHSVNRDELKRDLELTYKLILKQKKIEKRILGYTAHADEGFGRLDALNRIGNQVFYTNFLDEAAGELPEKVGSLSRSLLEKNFQRHDAPVSFPPLWDSPFFLWAQYDTSVGNELVRNAGEALGVNAKVNMTSPSVGKALFDSTVDMKALSRFEEALRGKDPFKHPGQTGPAFQGLHAPRWEHVQVKFSDAAWSNPQSLVDQGRVLYRTHCFECHRGPVRDAKFDAMWSDDSFWKERNSDGRKNWIVDGDRHYFNTVQIPVNVIGTDRQQARVLTERRVNLPDILGASPIDYLNNTGSCGLPRDIATDTPFVLALMAVVGKTIDQWFVANKTPEAEQRAMKGPRSNCHNKQVFIEAKAKQKDEVSGAEQAVLAIVPHYRARPLDGVWATAPYLHNGSVPTLDDMLLPQDRRARKFCVGSREFDPVNVGLVRKTHEEASCAAGLTNFDVTLEGNSNRGHSFEGTETDVKKLPAGVIGPALADEDRRALIAYLKSL